MKKDEVIEAPYQYIYLIPDFEGTQMSMPGGKTLTRPHGYTWCEQNPFSKGEEGYEDVVCYRRVKKLKKGKKNETNKRGGIK